MTTTPIYRHAGMYIIIFISCTIPTLSFVSSQQLWHSFCVANQQQSCSIPSHVCLCRYSIMGKHHTQKTLSVGCPFCQPVTKTPPEKIKFLCNRNICLCCSFTGVFKIQRKIFILSFRSQSVYLAQQRLACLDWQSLRYGNNQSLNNE